MIKMDSSVGVGLDMLILCISLYILFNTNILRAKELLHSLFVVPQPYKQYYISH